MQPRLACFPMIQAELLTGRFFEDDAEVETPEVVLSYKLAHSLAGAADPASMLDRQISVGPFSAQVVGVLTGDESSPPMLYGAFYNLEYPDGGSATLRYAFARESG